ERSCAERAHARKGRVIPLPPGAMASMEDLQRHLGEVNGSLEKVVSTQCCQSLVLEELRSLILELKSLTESKRNGMYIEIPKDPPKLPGVVLEPEAPGSPLGPKNKKGKKRVASTLGKVSEELSDILSSARGSAAGQRAEGAHSEGAREQRKGLEVPEDSRVSQKNKKTHATTFLGLLSTPKRTPAVSMENLEAQTA
ncbi:unnamed protein product, partial [Durusdinium trenchii]